MKKVLLVISIYFIGTFGAVADKLECKDFKGEWKGNKKGKGYQGDITILFDNNCNYKWVGSNGKIITPGKIKIKKENIIGYNNRAGSRGKVTIEENTLTWKNVFTGNNYKVFVKKINTGE